MFDGVANRSSQRGCRTQAQVSGVYFDMQCANGDPDCASTDGPEGPQECAKNIYLGDGCRMPDGTFNGTSCKAARSRSTASIWRGGAVNDYIAQGGSGFDVLKRNTTKFNTGISLRDALVDYIRTLTTRAATRRNYTNIVGVTCKDSQGETFDCSTTCCCHDPDQSADQIACATDCDQPSTCAPPASSVSTTWARSTTARSSAARTTSRVVSSPARPPRPSSPPASKPACSATAQFLAMATPPVNDIIALTPPASTKTCRESHDDSHRDLRPAAMAEMSNSVDAEPSTNETTTSRFGALAGVQHHARPRRRPRQVSSDFELEICSIRRRARWGRRTAPVSASAGDVQPAARSTIAAWSWPDDSAWTCSSRSAASRSGLELASCGAERQPAHHHHAS